MVPAAAMKRSRHAQCRLMVVILGETPAVRVCPAVVVPCGNQTAVDADVT